MRILIDTNIFIPLEDSSNVLDESFSELVRLAGENNHQILAHPSSLDDIERDKDEERKKIRLSRIRKYPLLENPPTVDLQALKNLGFIDNKDNDRVDNDILWAIYKDAANILVTEDRGIHRKASILGVRGRVHYIQQAAQSLKRLHKTVHVSLPNIKEKSLHQIDLKNNFFDSLRDDYIEFNEWYRRSSRNGRKAWVYEDGSNQLGAILIYKEENDEIVTDDNKAIPGRVLKICTFKVGEDVRGRKIGELFLKAAFRYATANKIESIYITMRQGKHEFLEDLCVDFGFYKYGVCKGDSVYIKDHPIDPPKDVENTLNALEYHKMYYPHFIRDTSVSKYIVPIQPAYHQILFPDNQQQLRLFTYSAVGNAIKQAYLCHARIGGISPGDILLFYRSKDRKAITSIGIVETADEFNDADNIIQLVSKRTVYSFDEIVDMAEKRTKVILFRLSMHLRHPIKYDWLLKERIVNGAIQTIRKISNDSFEKIISE
ncbi:MAG: N-acetyltransferase [Desulfobacterium sp.]|nr:N-acetyltransferase [Desulfobacterium sp.]